MKLLYIEDNGLLISGVKKALSKLYTVDAVRTGHEGIEKARWTNYGLILLDLGLPDMNGLEVCKALRQAGIHTPIIILTVRKDPDTSVNLLNSGADDFIAKPFNGDILKAHIAAVLRRNQELKAEKIVTIDDLTVNVTRRQVQRGDAKIQLRRKEFDILEYLATNRGHTLTRAMILDHVWESGKESWNNTVDVHIKHLRDKVDRPFAKPLIKTTYGVGYMIDDA